MAKRLGYGGLANTNGARDFIGKAEATDEGSVLHFRSNDFNRRRYGGLWGYAMVIFALIGARYAR